MKLSRNRWGGVRRVTQYMAYYCCYVPFIPLTGGPGGGIVRHKYIYTYARHPRQTPGTPKFRHLQPPPWPGAASPVPGLGLLRPARPAPAQVRELAGAAEGTVFDGASRQRVWVVPADALPGAGALCGPRSGGALAGQARPAPGPQVDGRGAPVLGAGA